MHWRYLAVLAALASLWMPSTAAASRTLDVDPHHVKFGKQPFHNFTTRSFTVTNVSKRTINVSVVPGLVPDDFSPGQPDSTCALASDTTLAPGASCTHVVGYYPDPAEPFLGPRRIKLQVVARSLFGKKIERREVKVTGQAVPPITIAPPQMRFGTQPFETFATRTVTIKNKTAMPLIVTVDAQLPDDFSDLIDSTCVLGDTELVPGGSCTHVVGFRPTPFFGGFETASLVVTVRNLAGTQLYQQLVEITGTGA
jgi:hypothetical protein